MKKPTYWLEQAKTKLASDSDAALAHALGCSRQSISQHRHGKHNMSIRTALTIARILEVNPMIVIATTMYHQATTDEERKFWTDTVRRYQSPERPA